MKKISVFFAAASLFIGFSISAHADPLIDAHLISVYVDRMEIERPEYQTPIEIFLRRKDDAPGVNVGRVWLTQGQAHQAFYSALLTAYAAKTLVDINSDGEGYVSRLELENKR